MGNIYDNTSDRQKADRELEQKVYSYVAGEPFSDRNKTLQSMGIWTSGRADVTGVAQPEEVRTELISDGILHTLDDRYWASGFPKPLKIFA